MPLRQSIVFIDPLIANLGKDIYSQQSTLKPQISECLYKMMLVMILIKIACIQYVGLHVCGKSKKNVSRCNILQDICKSNRSLRLCRGLWFHSLDFRFYCYINKACFYCVRQMIAVTEPHCATGERYFQ